MSTVGDSSRSNSSSPRSLRIPDKYRVLLEEAVDQSGTTASRLLLAGSALPACLFNSITLRETSQVLKFQKHLNTIGKSVSLIADLDLVAEAGITQEELNGFFAVFHKLSIAIKHRKAAIEKGNPKKLSGGKKRA